MNEITQFIPYHEAQKYHDEGWTLSRLPGSHGKHSVLATMPEDTWKRLGDVAKGVVSELKK